jgi:membrane protein implicated in regulation of membrane protease activity
MKIMNALGELLGAAIGAAILWSSVPLFIIVLSAVGAFFEAYLALVIYAFPLFILIYYGKIFYDDYKKRKAAK